MRLVFRCSLILQMADLEDKILKQNIPGRWSTHDDNADDGWALRDCDDDDNGVAK